TDVGATLVKHDDLASIQVLQLVSPGCSCLFVAFSGTHRLFFRVHPTRLMARPIVVVLTRKPCSCSQLRQCISKVASGYACNWATNPASKGAYFLEGRPGIGLTLTFPVSRRCLR